MTDRFNADGGAGFRANVADFGASATPEQRGGVEAETQGPHSSAGFRRALERTARKGGKLASHMPDKTNFSGSGYKKPSQFAQGGQRHGLHVGGSPAGAIDAVSTGGTF